MKKYIAMILTILLICTAATGCGKSSDTTTDSDIHSGSESPAGQPEQAANLSTSYTAYMEIKSDLVSRLADGLTESQPAASMELLGMNMVEMFLLPMVALGVDETYAKATLGYFNAADIKYTSNGNNYAVTYTGADGVQMTCETSYDPAKDAAMTKISQAGKESLVFEYLKTSYGYASQYYVQNDDGTYTVYQGTFYGKDGIIGVSVDAEAPPAPITGGADVPKEFPKDCSSWYEVKGTAGTGSLSDGTKLEFTVPAEAYN